MLFVERLAGLFASEKIRGQLQLFLTGGGSADTDSGVVSCNEVDVPFCRRRIAAADVAEAIGEDRKVAAVYVCGVPAMTDLLVEQLVEPEGVGMEPYRSCSRSGGEGGSFLA